MSYEYMPQDGYRFICKLFSIICRDNQMRLVFDSNVKNIDNKDNNTVVKEFLSCKWASFSSKIINGGKKQGDQIQEHFLRFHARKGDDYDILLRNYQYYITRTVQAIIENRKETRDPQVSLGLAAVVSVALMNDLSDADFYIGREEAKKILFLCMDYFDYQNTEFIPDECFDERENFSKLLFSALFATLMFLFPAKTEIRASNYDRGFDSISRVIASDVQSTLYTAFLHVSEAAFIASQLWDLKYTGEPYLEPLSFVSIKNNYIIPSIISNNRRMGVMSHERGQPVRSLVEGRSGIGKSTLARLIASFSLRDCCSSEKCRQMKTLLDISTKLWPIIIECKALRLEEFEQGIIQCGLNQMLFRANNLGAGISIVHFEECIEYLMAFCKHKIMQESLVLIIDDYSKIPLECLDQFNRFLNKLYMEPRIHIVVLTDRLKPSVKQRLSRHFNVFSVRDFSPEKSYIDCAVKDIYKNEDATDTMDQFVQLYANTPRRLLRYVQALQHSESIFDVLSTCIEEELDTRECYFEYREEYPMFLKELALWILKRRSEADIHNGKLTISEKQVVRFLSGHSEKSDEWREIWRCINLESVILEQCGSVNSMEFCTPMYLYSILADYYAELLRNSNLCQNYEEWIDNLSYFTGSEFAYVFLILFNRLSLDGFRDIAETKLALFMKAVVSKMFEFDRYKDIEYVKWAVETVVSDAEYEKAFLRDGDTSERAKIWKTFRRAYIAMDHSVNLYRELNLLSG